MINQFEIWIADLNPTVDTEPGKIRPVLIVQSNLLNDLSHPSTLICPISTNIIKNTEILRVNIPKDEFGLKEDSSILIDHVRSIDNNRLKYKIGAVNENLTLVIKKNLKIVMDL